MEYPWHPTPPTGNFCPVCSNSHYPFCPPPPPQFFRPPPPTPDQFFHSPLPPPLPSPVPPPPPPSQTSYDPFVDHQGGPTINPYPPQAQIPPRPWNPNPNFGNDYYGSANPGLDYDNNCQIGVKRMRVDTLADDERRLKLIRDHGAASHGLDRNYGGGYMYPSDYVEPGNFCERGGNFGDRLQGIEGGYREEISSHAKQTYGEQKIACHHIENNKNHGYGNIVHGADGYRKFEQPGGRHETVAYNNTTYQEQRNNFSTESQKFNSQFLQSPAKHTHIMERKSAYYGLPNRGENVGLRGQPPLPTSPPPPLPEEPPRFGYSDSVVSSPASGPSSLFPIALNAGSSFQSPYAMGSEAITSVSTPYSIRPKPNSSGYYPEEIRALSMASSKGERGQFSPRHLLVEKPKVIDASHILKHPYRANRPDHIVIILRGLPGGGKSYLAKVLRDLEVESGGIAPRIHSMDEYFMTEVEKVDESEGSRTSGVGRGKKPVMKKVMEYCYEPEMEEAYRSSMLKAFKKTLDEGAFPFVIVDDRNLRVADFAQFWATAKRSGYEVYLLEATYKDPVGCAARNVHGFTQSDINEMANRWEEAPSLYMKLDVKSLLHGDDLEESGIQEVDMDTEDGNNVGDPSSSEDINIDKVVRPSEDLATDGPLKDEQRIDAAGEHPLGVVKELGKSKWSNDLEDDDVQKTEATQGNSSALSGLIKSYSKKGKSVRWSDQIGSIGFSIGTGKTTNVSLVIGPGSGYNLKSNPLPEGERQSQRSGEPRQRNIFQEQLRAERESFRAVFDKRRQRIGGLDVDEE